MKNEITHFGSVHSPYKNGHNSFSDVSSVTAIMNFKTVRLLVIYLILTGTAESNWKTSENKNSYAAERSATTSSEKSDSLPEGVTDEWLNRLTDEKGNLIIPEANTGRSGNVPEDPEGDALQRKIFNGFGIGHKFGRSVSSAGDVNGDGYSDIIVGAYGYSSFTGRAYIYFGGLNMNTVADVTFTGENINNNFGYGVSSAGDVNGDGYSDVIIGSFAHSSNTGKAYIYFGGTAMNNAADVTFTGENTNEYFGLRVSSAGDVNSDGYSDVIIGAYGYSSETGRAYIYFGGATMNNAADVTMTGEAPNNSFGVSASTAGDVNGDGYSDVIVSAYEYSSYTGRAYIYLGGASMDNTADVTMTGEALDNYFGLALPSAGDVNGDGYSDVFVTGYGYSSSTGRVYIFLGGVSLNNTADVTMTGEATGDAFGISVSSAGDINGDGYPDVIVGADGYSSFTGKAYIFFGGASMNNTADMTMTGEATNNQFGQSVSSAGDVNGDGYSDVIVGAEGHSANTGRVYLYDYFMKNEIIPDVTMTGEATSNSFGISVSSAGDVNGDGFSDVIVGAQGYSSNTGRAYVFFGGVSMDNNADVTLTGEATGNKFGHSVSSAGDVNADGYSDVIVSAFVYSSDTGRAYIYFGGASMNNSADITMTGEAISNFFGFSVSSAGDVNGDGYSDVIVGAWGYSSSTGRAYVYFGGSSMNNTADVTMTGEATNNGFGFSVSSAGDVNGDGYSDVIVGADGYSTGTGRAYIYIGGVSMNNTADLTMTGETTNNLFGRSVSSAGDVNGDGYSDVIVGAFGYSTSSGRTYIYFGGLNMNTVADVTMTGESTNNEFGLSVSSAGDVNGDGFSDVIVGANRYSSFTGRSYIFFGGASMNDTADVTMTGETTSTSFGFSVSSAGDVNGDGYSDVFIGAPGFSLSGGTYLYLASQINIKPNLLYVKDVPNDQGGKVNLKWLKSGFDVYGNNTLTDYYIEMSNPPTGGNFAWIPAGTVAATKNSFYSYIATTPYDSSTNSSGTFYFRVTARTSEPSQYWRSNIMSGHGVDNLAPVAPASLTATPDNNSIYLAWIQNEEVDLHYYIIYRDGIEIGTSVNNNFDDASVLTATYGYRVAAVDIHGNIGPLSNLATATFSGFGTIDLTVIMEGFYDPALNNMRMSDTLKVYLRNSSAPYAIVDSAKSVVNANTFTGTFQFANAPTGTYYIQIKHRNTIETWSGTVLSYTLGAAHSFNFTTSASQAFGSNMRQVDAAPLRFGIYSGDVNKDGTVDLSDLVQTYNGSNVFASGYVATDLNGDNIVDLNDVLIAYNNSSSFVVVVKP